MAFAEDIEARLVPARNYSNFPMRFLVPRRLPGDGRTPDLISTARE